MTVRYLSALPGVTDFSGTRHHNPDAPPGSPSGPQSGVQVAHITGTSEGMLASAGELHSNFIPMIYSPMLPAAVARKNRWPLNSLTPGWRAGLACISIAGQIAGLATRVVAENSFIAGYLAGTVGIDPGKITLVGMPVIGIPTAGQPHRERKGAESGNLLVAFADELTPEWNVLHLIFALEKINAGAVIISGGTEGDYGRACQERAALNPRVKLILCDVTRMETDAQAAAEIAAALGNATIIVDPSAGGLCYSLIASAVGMGIPAVISRRSVCRLSLPGGVELFEPTSWELLNHAVTTAFNHATATATTTGPGSDVSADPQAKVPEVAISRAGVAMKFREIYNQVTRENVR